jgi:hypothetical protein
MLPALAGWYQLLYSWHGCGTVIFRRRPARKIHIQLPALTL